ncbi:MAG: DAK2 domain-containing protein [Clostridiaceae bacterium]|nr:DAK2 domain-containing protein [Clostridiaceae bacterium]
MNVKMDGRLFRAMIREAAYAINENKQRLNDLNVFPVPDGDTGTNMGLTIGAAARALEDRHEESLSAIADVAAMALLRGARGNSGVILSLLFRGIAKTFKGHDSADGVLLADALACAADTAYRAVMKPTEGTILTVARVSAESARIAAETNADPLEVLSSTFESAQKALYETTTQNPVLSRAGVVDAGGAGWVVVLSSMLKVLRGDEPHESISADTAAVAEPAHASAQAAFSADEIRFAYCTEFIVNRTGNREPGILRGFLEGIGDCVVVVDDDEIIKVHVHTNNPGQAIEEAITFGSLDSIKIENMRIQHSEKVLSGTNSAKSAPSEPEIPAAGTPAEREPVAFVAVVAGEGLATVFRDLGVHALVEGGQTMNPSTMDILQAVESVPSDVVFVLPNNKNIIMAAQQAAPLTQKTLYVLPTVSVPQGISAMLAYETDRSPEENREAMEAAFSHTHTALLTYAARDSVLDDRRIREGDYLSLMDGRLVDTNRRERDAVARLSKEIAKLSSLSYITVFYGKGVDGTAADAVRAQLARDCPDAEVSVVYGGQPIYYYIISAE